MQTIDLVEFTNNFLEISDNLTYAEIRMLYLLITEPDVIDLSQQEFADRIHAHRRTINIGFKKLKKHNYLIYEKIDDSQMESINTENHLNNSSLDKSQEKQAKRVIKNLMSEFYNEKQKRRLIINEDFYSFVIGDHRLQDIFRYNKDIITKTIQEAYPEAKFHFKQKKADYPDEIQYNIIRLVNIEISNNINSKQYYIDRVKFMNNLYEKYSIEEEQALKVVKSAFPKLVINDDVIRLPKPWRGGKNR